MGLEAPNVIVGWRTDAANSLQADTLNVISNMLSNGKAGLFDLDLNNPMKVMGAEAGLQSDHDYGIFLLQGTPKEGQGTAEVRQLMLDEIKKLKKGQFSDDLLPSVVNNMKLSFYQGLRSNEQRANRFVNAFINDEKWADRVNAMNRISKMTKQQIVDFANRFFTDSAMYPSSRYKATTRQSTRLRSRRLPRYRQTTTSRVLSSKKSWSQSRSLSSLSLPISSVTSR